MDALGIYREGETIKIALARRKKKQMDVLGIYTFSQNERERLHTFLCEDVFSLAKRKVKPFYIREKALIASGLNASDIVLRSLYLQLVRKREIHSVLPFQAESLIPFPSEETILFPITREKGKTFTEISLFATSQSHLKQHLEEFLALEITPDIISCTPMALLRFSQFVFPNLPHLFCAHVGHDKTLFIGVSNKKLHCFQILPMGLMHFFQALKKDCPEKTSQELFEIAQSLELSPPSPVSFSHLNGCRESFQGQVERMMTFLNGKMQGVSISDFFLTGDFSSAPKFPEFFQRIIGSSFSFLTTGSKDLSSYLSHAIPLGLAFDALAEDASSLQLLQGPLIPRDTIKKRWKKLFSFCAAFALLTVVLSVFSSFLISKREKVLLERFRISALAENGVSKRDLLEKKRRQLEKEISKQTKSFPYSHSLPTVSDFLVWLETHPALAEKKDESGKIETIDIHRVHYELTKYPMIGSENENYQAKVEIEFTASSPSIAREFHNILLSGDPMIYPKSEIQWKTLSDAYYTSFFLNPEARKKR